MGFVKVVKNKAYFKRFQVKFRRRREGKTDYQARKALITQDKNKYGSPKYRFVVRFSNTDVTCQIIRAKIIGDEVMAAAYSHELPRYGMPLGLTNYAATYATGLLLARRFLKKIKLDGKYQGVPKANGEDYNVEPLEKGPNPFYALLDVGLRRTTTGSKVFAAMKGACDGGIEIPHSETRFVGYDDEEKKLDAEVLKKHIFGGHVAEYMKYLEKENPSRYEKQFSRYIKAKISADDIEKKWAQVHDAIRKNPDFVKTAKPAPKEKKTFRHAKRSLSQRKDRVRQKIAAKNRVKN